jgi:regulator of protease activity HflC (stomatin/prohibitin superfamily)
MDNIILNFLISPLVWEVIIGLYVIKKSVCLVPQNGGFMVYIMGPYSQTFSAGVNFIIPFIQTIAADRNLKEQSLHITSQSVITRDNITLNIDGILSLKVVDAAAAGNNIMDYKLSVIQLAMTTMRNAVGSLELDECFQNRDTINSKILTVMTETTQS